MTTLKLSKEQESTLNKCETTTGKCKYLHSIGWPTGAIAKYLGTYYQKVRNMINCETKNPVDKYHLK